MKTIPSKNRTEHKSYCKRYRTSWYCQTPCVAGFFVGSLLAGIPLAALLTLYLHDQIPVLSTITTSSTSSTTKTTTTATSSTSSTSTTTTSSTSSSSTVNTTSTISTSTTTTTSTSSTATTTTTTTSSSSSTSTATTSSTTSVTTRTTSSTSSTSATSTTATTTTTTVPICSSSGRGILSTFSTTTPSSWTTYSINYTAVAATTVLLFGFKGEPARYFYLDDVSVVDINVPSIQLLSNPSFEDASTLASWTVWCLSTCSTSSGTVIAGSNCYLSSGRCFSANCVSGIGFLGQSFSTAIGNTYRISFRLIAKWGLLSVNKFYVDAV